MLTFICWVVILAAIFSEPYWQVMAKKDEMYNREATSLLRVLTIISMLAILIMN